MEHFELAIIGAGPGGYVAAIRAAQLGINTVLVERDDIGGTCLNRGCIPTKTILHTAGLFSEISHAEALGIRIESAAVDFDALRMRTAEVRESLRDGVEALVAANGITLMRGTATIAGLDGITVSQPDGTIAEISADHLIIATGSAPAKPPIAGIGEDGVLTSDDMLETIPELKRLVIVGGGVIGMEFAGIYAALKTHVTVLEAAPRILPTMDREFGQSLAMLYRKRGCAIVANALVESIERAADGSLSVRYAVKDAAETVDADAVLVATGRAPAFGGLFAEGFELELDRGRIAVDKRMQTSAEGIYAIGDVAAAGAQLAHAASAQGIVAVETIAGADVSFDPALVPSCVYSSPEIASVGMTEAEAKQAGIAARAGKFAMTGNGKSVITGQGRSFAKIVADESDRIIGAQLMCGRATDMIGELSLAVANGLTIEQMKSAIRPHPTFEEAIGEAFEAFAGGAIHAMPKPR